MGDNHPVAGDVRVRAGIGLTAVVWMVALAPASAEPAPPGPGAPTGAAGDPIRVARARLEQHAFKLQLHLRATRALRPADLTSRGRSLCLLLAGRAAPDETLCIGRARLTLQRGARTRRFRSRIEIAGGRVQVTFRYAVEGVRPGALTWQVRSGDPACSVPAGCVASYPDRPVRLRILAPRPVGCVRRGTALLRRRDGAGRRVAIGFDDGPSPYTARVVRVLVRMRARATFFMLGRALRSSPATARMVLAAGQELGNHSYNHASLPASWQLSATSAAMRAATGFRPCLFRPPYGNVSGPLVGAALGLGMTTVVWDVDPRDWSTPGAGAIAGRVVSAARPGSIVVMHDGGGPRGQTVAALPAIVSGLRRRGLRLVGIGELLGYRTLWYPR